MENGRVPSFWEGFLSLLYLVANVLNIVESLDEYGLVKPVLGRDSDALI